MRYVALALGLGLLAFWAWAFLSGAMSRRDEPWAGFRDHELSFVVPDVIVGVALLAVAWFGEPQSAVAQRLAYACAGALGFLGTLDAGYLIRTWGLRSRGMRTRTAFVVVVCWVGASTLAILAGAMPTEIR